jgi:hypothetical protein
MLTLLRFVNPKLWLALILLMLLLAGGVHIYNLGRHSATTEQLQGALKDESLRNKTNRDIGALPDQSLGELLSTWAHN